VAGRIGDQRIGLADAVLVGPGAERLMTAGTVNEVRHI